MSQTTVDALIQREMQLQVFKGFRGGVDALVPMWFQARTFETRMLLQWDNNYGAYLSWDPNPQGGKVVIMSDIYDMAPGDLVTFDGNPPSTKIPGGGHPGALSIVNNRQPASGGFAQMLAGQSYAQPVCVIPMATGTQYIFRPYEKLIITLSPVSLNNSTIVEQVTTQSVTIDLSRTSSSHIFYDITAGWYAQDDNVTVNNGPLNLASVLNMHS